MMRRTWPGAAAVLGAVLLAAAGSAPPEPDGYRTEAYRAPTPATLQGVKVLSTSEAQALWEENAAAFVDVLPQPPRPADLPAGTLWLPRPRHDIPGSIWLPDTGYGELAPAMQRYFESGLEQATNGERSRIVVFYCLVDCWMSWNAAKRALALGWKNVAWYPDGTDGWEAAGLPVEERKPLPRPSMPASGR